MVQGIGSSGSLYSIPAYKEFYAMYQRSGANINFIAWLELKGLTTEFYRQIENYMETGNVDNGDDSVDSINENKQVSSGRYSMFQSEDEETFYEFDWAEGTYSVMDKKQAAEALGASGAVFDTLNFINNRAVFTDYTFGHLEDGQDEYNRRTFSSSKYGSLAKLVEKEFDLDYIFNAIYQDPSDPQYAIAVSLFNEINEAVDQWLPLDQQEALYKVQQQYGTNSAEYKDALKKAILDNLDQAKEWLEGHEHLRVAAGDTSQFAPQTENEEQGVVPNYSFETVLQNSGLSAAYHGNQVWSGSKHYDNNTCEQASVDDARNYIEEQLTNYINTLIAEMGDECTDEIKEYMLMAKAAVVGSCAKSKGESNWGGYVFAGVTTAAAVVGTVLTCGTAAPAALATAAAVWGGVGAGLGAGLGAAFTKGSEGIQQAASNIKDVITVKTFGGGPFSDWGARAQVNVKNMIDQFNRVFEALCKNKGKTDEQIAAEKAEREAENEKQRQGYSILYNMNMRTVAQDANIDYSYNVNNPKSADDLKQEAESKVLYALKNEIRAKLAGQNIPTADLNAILDFATEEALKNPSDWSKQYSDYSYVISTENLVSQFEDAVKTAIKAKGFKF